MAGGRKEVALALESVSWLRAGHVRGEGGLLLWGQRGLMQEEQLRISLLSAK